MNTDQKLQRIVEAIVNKRLSKLKTRLNESEDAYTTTFNQIDWNNVAAEILKIFKIKTTLRFEQNGRNVRMISDNIIKQCGIFQYAISRCNLTFFNNGLKPGGTDSIFWAQINLSYPGNGMNIGTVWVTLDGKVIVKKDSPR